MKGYLISEYIKPQQLKLQDDVPDPKPKPNQVVVEVFAAGLNYFDILQVQGKYQVQPPFPWVAGTEFAGRIALDTKIPKGCPLNPGDRVAGAAQGAFAEKVACDWKLLFLIPDGMSYEEATALTITWHTSYEALVGRANLQPGEWVLVHAAAGGVGLVAVQIAKALGAKVIATAGSEDKLKVCKDLGGADEVVNYRDQSWQKTVMRITGGKGVDVVYDPVGMVQPSLKVIAWKGRIVIVGFAAGSIEKIPMNLVLLKNISLVGLHWGAYMKHEFHRVPEVYAQLMMLYKKGQLKPSSYSTIYGFENAAEGLLAIGARRTWGKVVLRVKPTPAEPTLAKL